MAFSLLSVTVGHPPWLHNLENKGHSKGHALSEDLLRFNWEVIVLCFFTKQGARYVVQVQVRRQQQVRQEGCPAGRSWPTPRQCWIGLRRAGAGPEGGRGSGVAWVSPAPVSAAPSAVSPASYRQEARAKIRIGSQPLLASDPSSSSGDYYDHRLFEPMTFRLLQWKKFDNSIYIT